MLLTRPTNHAQFCLGKSILVNDSILTFEKPTLVATLTVRSPNRCTALEK